MSLEIMQLFQGGVYTNTVVVQRHSVVMTKTDKIYKVSGPPTPPPPIGRYTAMRRIE
jgi:hypothetical protein